MIKKYISLFMVLAFSLGSVFALSQDEIDAANSLAEKWIIEDHSDFPEEYRLWDNITRRETMKIVMKLSGLEIDDKCEWKFSDLPETDWGCKYVESALNYWFIAPNPKFRPDDNITKIESMKLVLKAKWVEKIQITENWQEDYMETAYEYWIIDEKYYDYDAEAKRWWIFKITTATIEKEEEIKEKQNQIYTDEPSI